MVLDFRNRENSHKSTKKRNKFKMNGIMWPVYKFILVFISQPLSFPSNLLLADGQEMRAVA